MMLGISMKKPRPIYARTFEIILAIATIGPASAFLILPALIVAFHDFTLAIMTIGLIGLWYSIFFPEDSWFKIPFLIWAFFICGIASWFMLLYMVVDWPVSKIWFNYGALVIIFFMLWGIYKTYRFLRLARQRYFPSHPSTLI